MKKILLGVLALTISIINCQLSTISAAPRTAEQAAQLAAEFTNDQTPQLRQQKSALTPNTLRLAHTGLKPASNEPAFFVFNKADNNGWVIVSADDNAKTILGYSDEGAFNAETIPSNFRFWLDYHAERIAAAKPAASNIKKAAAATYSPVAPLLGLIKWDQGTPYNNKCPTDALDNTKSYTGCVATAGAQVMGFWRWPAQGTGKHTYTWENCTKYSSSGYCSKSTDHEITVTYNVNYDWDNIIPNYFWGYNTTQANAIATLMYHVGVGCNMAYGGDDAGGSAAYTSDLASTMKSNFKYNAQYTNYGDADAALKTTFYSEVKAGRPIIIGGSDGGNYGHEFVCDGVDANGLFHINWGWSGMSDGFFELTALDPNAEGIGGAGSGNGYSKSLDFIYNITPNQSTGNVTAVEVTPANVTLKINERQQMAAVFTPVNAMNRAMYWESEDESIATVTGEGKVRGVAPGTTKIYAKSYAGPSHYCTVTVTEEVYTGEELSVDAAYAVYDTELSDKWGIRIYDAATNVPWVRLNFNSGSSSKIAGVYDLANGKAYYWFSDDDSKYLLSTAGSLTVKCVGEKNGPNGCNTYEIDAWFEANDDKAYRFNATVEICATDANERKITLTDKKYVAVTGVSLSQDEATIKVNEKLQLTATVTPTEATTKTVTWSSDKPEVATVSASGLVKGIRDGNATITATTDDGGFTATCDITVSGTLVSENFTLLTDINDLAAEDEIIIVCVSKLDAATGSLKQTSNATYLQTTTVTIKEDEIELDEGSNVAVLTVGGSADNWTLTNSDGKKLGAIAAKKLAWDEGTTTWNISLSGSDATIANTTENFGRILYNVSSPRFTTYTSTLTSNMLLPQIFIRKYTTPTSFIQTIDDQQAATKRIIDGRLVIIVDGVQYNALGQRME